MKKRGAYLVILVMVLTLIGCGGSDSKVENDTSNTEQKESVLENGEAKNNYVLEKTITYDAEGKVTQTKIYETDSKGNYVKYKVTNKEGKTIETGTYEYDKDGNRIALKVKDGSNNDTYSYKYMFDEKGNETQIESYAKGVITQKRILKDGKDVKTIFYNEGKETYWIENEVDETGTGKAVFRMNSGGTTYDFAYNDIKYDESTRTISTSYYYGIGDAAKLKNVTTIVVDEHNNRISYSFVGYDGTLLNGKSEVKTTTKNEYDENGNLTKHTVYDESGKVTTSVEYSYKAF